MLSRKKPESEATRFGKSSTLISLLACVPLLANCLFLFKWGALTEDDLTIMGFTGAATLVLMGWSMHLAYRSYQGDEPNHWPAATLMLAFGQASLLICLALVAAARA